MLLRYLKCRKNIESKKPKVVKAKNGRIIVTSNAMVWNNKNQNLSNYKKLVDYKVIED